MFHDLARICELLSAIHWDSHLDSITLPAVHIEHESVVALIAKDWQHANILSVCEHNEATERNHLFQELLVQAFPKNAEPPFILVRVYGFFDRQDKLTQRSRRTRLLDIYGCESHS